MDWFQSLKIKLTRKPIRFFSAAVSVEEKKLLVFSFIHDTSLKFKMKNIYWNSLKLLSTRNIVLRKIRDCQYISCMNYIKLLVPFASDTHSSRAITWMSTFRGIHDVVWIIWIYYKSYVVLPSSIVHHFPHAIKSPNLSNALLFCSSERLRLDLTIQTTAKITPERNSDGLTSVWQKNFHEYIIFLGQYQNIKY